MSDLRTRIANAIWEELRTQNNVVNFDRLADAVIRELGLQREQLGEDSGYPHHQHRYVTEWFTNG